MMLFKIRITDFKIYLQPLRFGFYISYWKLTKTEFY